MHKYWRHLGDYARKTRHLTMMEHGAYTLLLDWYYDHEKALPRCEDEVLRLMGASSRHEKKAVCSVLREFFTLTDEGWRNDRAEAELTEYQCKSEKTRHAAEKRWQSGRNADASPMHDGGNASRARSNNQQPTTSNQSTATAGAAAGSMMGDSLIPDGDSGEKKKGPSFAKASEGEPKGSGRRQGEYEGVAEGLYELYPRKVGKVAAIKAIVKVLKAGEVTELELRSSVNLYRRAVEGWPEQDRTFIPHPATWFNRGSYLDDPATWARDPRPAQKKEGGAAAVAPVREAALVQVVEAPAGWRTAMRELWGDRWEEFYGAFETMLPADQRQVRAWLQENGPGAFECAVPADWREKWADLFDQSEWTDVPETWADVCAAERRAIVNGGR